MPIINPVQQMLSEAGLSKSSQGKKPGAESITELLEEAGLGIRETLRDLADTRDISELETNRTRINETILKMHGVLKDATAIPQAVTIVINDMDGAPVRENPIFLPRSLKSPIPKTLEILDIEQVQ